ncbi:MAG: GNAT family N-acetyltransferase [Thermoplasmata archaeon]
MAGAPKGNLEESAQGIRICSGVPFPIFNWVLRNRFSESEADEQISATIHHFRARGLPFYWGIFPDDRPRNLRERLLAAGFEAEEAPAMAIELDRPPTPPPRKGLSIEPVRTMEQVRVFAETLNAGDFQAAPEVAETIPDVLRPSLSSGSAEPHLRCFVGYHDGKPVATSARFLSGGVVGIYGIATVPAARRRGFGMSMTLAALEDGRTLGYRSGVLTATTMGEPLYRHLGFRELYRLTQIVVPATNEPPQAHA